MPKVMSKLAKFLRPATSYPQVGLSAELVLTTYLSNSIFLDNEDVSDFSVRVSSVDTKSF
jgi:hypothetical protein